MTWFRVEASLRDHELLGVIADSLRVSIPEAAGLYILTLAGFADHQPNGRPSLVSDSVLERWAGWTGKRGRFAQLFRDRLVEQRDGQRDPPGQIKGWWRQAALFKEQLRSRNRPGQGARGATEESREGTEKAPENYRNGSGEIPTGPPRGNEDEDGNGTTLLANGQGAREADPIRYAQRCTVAANRGMRENPLMQGFNELVTSAQDEPGVWLREGIPLAVAEGAIYHRAKAYRPRGRRTQPTTLGYFREAVMDAWAKARDRALEGGVNVTPLPEAEDLDEYERVARQLEAKEREHAR